MEKEIVIDAENAVLGRLASYVAKQSILGKKIIIVNAEKAIIVGNKGEIIRRYHRKRKLGGPSLHGPFFPTTPERILKRTIRGMLEHRKGRGREALKKIMVYRDTPRQYEEAKKIKSGKGKKGITLKEISKLLRGGK